MPRPQKKNIKTKTSAKQTSPRAAKGGQSKARPVVKQQRKSIEQQRKQHASDPNYEAFQEVRKDSADVIMPNEGWCSIAYQKNGDRPTIGYGNTYHPDGREVKLGDKITENDKQRYFDAAYENLFDTIVKHLDISSMNRNQLIGINDMLYNRYPGCLTAKNGILSKSLNDYFKEQTMSSAIVASVYMTAAKDGSKDFPGLEPRRNRERKLIFGDNAEKVIQATNCIKNIEKWQNLPTEIICQLADLGPNVLNACLGNKDTPLAIAASKYCSNQTDENLKQFNKELQATQGMKMYVFAAEQEKITMPMITDLLYKQTLELSPIINSARNSELKMQNALNKSTKKEQTKTQQQTEPTKNNQPNPLLIAKNNGNSR